MNARSRGVVGLVFVASCAGSSGQHDSDGGTGDATGCDINLVFEPANPVINDHVKVTAQALTGGVLEYVWHVDGSPNTSYEAVDHSAIGFDVPTAVSHTVTVDISPASGCSQAQRTIDVGTSGAVVIYRMRVTPPANLAPPQESLIQVHGGQTSVDRPFLIDPGANVTGSVLSGATPIPAYVKWIPLVGPSFDLVTSTGAFSAHAQLQLHTVIVIPQDNALAPRARPWMPGGSSTFAVDAGTAVTGTVLDRSGNPLANAQVQLEQLGLPSTIATTAANGTFTVRAAFMTNQQTTVTITPPATSGLAKLAATALFELAMPLNVSFAASPATCDLAGTPVKRAGANQGSATVTIVGTLPGVAGTIANGATVTPANGSVHVNATANAGGTLPATLVPRAVLSAVVQLAAPGDLAVATFDASACATQAFDAPARITASGTVTSSVSTALVGARVEAMPTGALALANLIPVETTTTTNGAFSLQLAYGAHYALTVFDPGGRGSPRTFPDLTAAGIPVTVALAAAIAITCSVSIQGNPNPIQNASVQLRCASCTGVAGSQPIAQTATDIAGNYRVAVPDPGPSAPSDHGHEAGLRAALPRGRCSRRARACACGSAAPAGCRCEARALRPAGRERARPGARPGRPRRRSRRPKNGRAGEGAARGRRQDPGGQG
ncbi:hypothetical protein BH11MYX1_BH11MYX1_17570 [soil metagenome]